MWHYKKFLAKRGGVSQQFFLKNKWLEIKCRKKQGRLCGHLKQFIIERTTQRTG
jgi:hypothetical protein